MCAFLDGKQLVSSFCTALFQRSFTVSAFIMLCSVPFLVSLLFQWCINCIFQSLHEMETLANLTHELFRRTPPSFLGAFHLQLSLQSMLLFGIGFFCAFFTFSLEFSTLPVRKWSTESVYPVQYNLTQHCASLLLLLILFPWYHLSYLVDSSLREHHVFSIYYHFLKKTLLVWFSTK